MYGSLRQMAMSSTVLWSLFKVLPYHFKGILMLQLNVSKRVTLIVQNAANFDGKNFID
jgi:hypothetical protein